MENNYDKKDYLSLFVKICLGIVAATVIYFLIVNHYSNSNDERGTFGDLFGGLTATFTGFAFAGVIITIIMQMKELELTREELKKSVDAQDKTQKALNLQLKHMQSTTRIESVKNIVDSYTAMEENDKRIVAKAILEKLTEEIFYDEMFSDIVTPVVRRISHTDIRGKKLSSSGMIKYEEFDETKKNHLTITFQNDGPSVRVSSEITSSTSSPLSIKYSGVVETRASGGGIQTSYPALPKGDLVERGSKFQMTIGNITNETEIEFMMKYEGSFIKHEFIQNLVITRKGSKVTCDLQKVRLVKKASNDQSA